MAKETLRSLLKMPNVQLLLDSSERQAVALSHKEATDAATAKEMLACVKPFLHTVLKSIGRRTDADRNAFWAIVVSHMPLDLFKRQRGRSAMRELGVPYRVIREGLKMRKQLVDDERGWVILKTHTHRDRLQLRAKLFDTFWHSLLGSTPDNQNKEQIRVYRTTDGAMVARDLLLNRPVVIGNLRRQTELNGRAGTVIAFLHESGRYRVQLDAALTEADAATVCAACDGSALPSPVIFAVHGRNLIATDSVRANAYELHWRRAQEGTMKEILAAWKKSPEAVEVRDATQGNFQVGVNVLRKYRCRCIKIRGASECDCRKYSKVEVNLKRWNQRRTQWRSHYESIHGPCLCAICADPVLKEPWLGMSRSPADLEKALMRCPQLEFTQYALPGPQAFKT
eukprot:3187496-Prymnesium_polylepis.1